MMPRTEAEIADLVRNQPPMQSLGTLKEWLAASIAAIAEETEARDRLRLMISKVAPLAEGEPEDADVPDTLRFTAPHTLREEIFRVLKAANEAGTPGLSINEIVVRIGNDGNIEQPGYQTVRNALHAGSRSMIQRGEASQVSSDSRPVTYAAGQIEHQVSTKRYLDAIIVADPDTTLGDPVAAEFALTIGTYTERVLWPRNNGKRVHAGHTFKAIRNRGLIGAIKVMVEGATTSGFNGLHAIGRSDLAVERIVLRHPDRFDGETIEKAKARLAATEAETDKEVD